MELTGRIQGGEGWEGVSTQGYQHHWGPVVWEAHPTHGAVREPFAIHTLESHASPLYRLCLDKR